MFEVNFENVAECIRLMDTLGRTVLPFWGKSPQGEPQIISINHDNITIQTAQDNGWMRTSIMHRDGTVEEMYER